MKSQHTHVLKHQEHISDRRFSTEQQSSVIDFQLETSPSDQVGFSPHLLHSVTMLSIVPVWVTATLGFGKRHKWQNWNSRINFERKTFPFGSSCTLLPFRSSLKKIVNKEDQLKGLLHLLLLTILYLAFNLVFTIFLATTQDNKVKEQYYLLILLSCYESFHCHLHFSVFGTPCQSPQGSMWDPHHRCCCLPQRLHRPLILFILVLFFQDFLYKLLRQQNKLRKKMIGLMHIRAVKLNSIFFLTDSENRNKIQTKTKKKANSNWAYRMQKSD